MVGTLLRLPVTCAAVLFTTYTGKPFGKIYTYVQAGGGGGGGGFREPNMVQKLHLECKMLLNLKENTIKKLYTRTYFSRKIDTVVQH